MDFLEINNNKAILSLPNKVGHNIIYNIKIDNSFVDYLVIDFQKTTKITLSGILYIICVASSLNERTKSNMTTRFYCEIINIKGYLLNFMMNFGFLQQMSNKGNLFRVNESEIMTDKTLIETEKTFIKHQLKKGQSSGYDKNIIMPFSSIEMGEKRYFEYYIYNFRNQFSDYYDKLVALKFISLQNSTDGKLDEFYNDFAKTTFEIIKNIYDHAKSWGIGAIHANDKGVEIAYYDIGIGISNSMKSSPKYSTGKNIDLIKLALKDGVSSNPDKGDNKGRGFTVMQKFIEKRSGYLSIRTANYHIVNDNEKEVNWFPGTQIVVFIPKS